MDIWPLIQNFANRLDSYRLWILENDKQRQLRIQERKKQLEQRRKREIFPFFDLPLELRIMIYEHAMFDKEYKIPDYNRWEDRILLPVIFHIHPRITREIYQLCRTSLVIDITIPNRLMVNPNQSQWLVIIYLEDLYDDFILYYYAHKTVVRMLTAQNAAKRFQSVEGRRQIVMKVRVKCLRCGEKCTGLSGKPTCLECYWFSKFNSWKSWKLMLLREDKLFEFC
jgi:hypothetical protein